MLEQKQYSYLVNGEKVDETAFEEFVKHFKTLKSVDGNNIKAILLDSFLAEKKLIKDVLNFETLNKEMDSTKGHSTRLKANTPMTFLDEVVDNNTQPTNHKELNTLIQDYEKCVKKETGVKHNKNKPQLSLLFKQFPKALEAIVKCSEYGHEKYKETDEDYLNFKRVEGGSKSYADAGLRHRIFKKGTTDIDSQLPHSYHIAWNALAELELILEGK